MTQALMERPTVDLAAPVVTAEQLELVKKTVAQGATPDELRLYLYDCARQGVHPLDKLIHFTKRSNKYTPITSIDFMRIRAADTGEYAGSDDAAFAGSPQKEDFAASVTVWRFVQGQRCAFTATARWPEYKPEQNDFMWKKMPHTMLGKCAEALALRKGFPKQLAGLYAKEELDQAGPVENGRKTAAPIVTLAKPDHFDSWLDDMRAVADEGEAALKNAWTKSPKEHRAYLTATAPDTWESIKARASRVTGEQEA